MGISDILALITKGNRAYATREQASKAMRWIMLLLMANGALFAIAAVNSYTMALVLTAIGMGASFLALVVAAALVHGKKWEGDDATEAAHLSARNPGAPMREVMRDLNH